MGLLTWAQRALRHLAGEPRFTASRVMTGAEQVPSGDLYERDEDDNDDDAAALIDWVRDGRPSPGIEVDPATVARAIAAGLRPDELFGTREPLRFSPPRIQRYGERDRTPIIIEYVNDPPTTFPRGSMGEALTLAGRRPEVAALAQRWGIDNVTASMYFTWGYDDAQILRAQARNKHEAFLRSIDDAIEDMDGLYERPRALPVSTLRRCHICTCILNNPADPPSHDCGGECLWCTAVFYEDNGAARVLWGEFADYLIERATAEQDADHPVVAWPPRHVYRRPVTAPTLNCYPRGD